MCIHLRDDALGGGAVVLPVDVARVAQHAVTQVKVVVRPSAKERSMMVIQSCLLLHMVLTVCHISLIKKQIVPVFPTLLLSNQSDLSIKSENWSQCKPTLKPHFLSLLLKNLEIYCRARIIRDEPSQES